jgi:DnaJ-domain-containing protein 1
VYLNISVIHGAFAVKFGDVNEVKERFLQRMISSALADDEFHLAGFELIRDLAGFLDLHTALLFQILLTAGVDPDLFTNKVRLGGHRKPNETQPPSSRAANLKVLGLDCDPGPQQIQMACKTLVERYHPDVLRAQDMPEAEIKASGQFLVRINLAY